MMTTTLSELSRVASTLVAGLAIAVGSGCDSTPSPAASDAAIIDDGTPEALLASLKSAANRSLSGYYTALRDATDCEALPEICRLLTARADSARELLALRNAMVDAYGDAGAVAGSEMLRGAFLEQFDEIEHASVFAGSGDLAMLRLGTSVYRMRRIGGAWRIVQFPDPPYDPVASAEAIEIVVARAKRIRADVEAGRVPSLQDLELKLASLAGN
jgi:hypothetical protein